jgi:hypothetical protein
MIVVCHVSCGPSMEKAEADNGAAARLSQTIQQLQRLRKRDI